MTHDANPALGRKRFAISAIFLVNGIGIGVWAAFIPIIKERLRLDDASLAVVLFCVAVGAIVAMPISGRLCDRFGSRRVVAASGTLFGVALACATAAPSIALIASAAFLMGAGNGAMDVAMNVNGVTLQARGGRPIMSSLHGLFSSGTFIAAAAMAALIAAKLPQIVASIAGASLVVGAAMAGPATLEHETSHRETPGSKNARRIPRRLILLGVAAICGAVSEGTLVEWSGVYVRQSLHLGITAALGGFAAYAVAMSAARFSGDWIVHRIGAVALVRAGSLLAAGGLALALGVHTYIAVTLGFLIAGLGLANVSPLVYGAGGDDSQSSAGTGVAVVTTLGYSGFLIGPALIGYTAQHTSIDVAFAIVALFVIAIAAFAPALRDDGLRSA